jgi:hypothetical protein
MADSKVTELQACKAAADVCVTGTEFFAAERGDFERPLY